MATLPPAVPLPVVEPAPAVPRARSLSVVALISSSGGLEALSVVLRALPADLPAAVIALQHLQPDRPSHLAAILAQRTPLDVLVAVDKVRLRAGAVLVVPAGRHALVDHDGCLRLVHTNSYPPPRPSADILLCTLATAVGPRAVAVVLSGSGHDGAIGVQAVSVCGGTVLVQDPGSAAFASMPEAALAADSAEPPLQLAELGPRLDTVVRRLTLQDKDFEQSPERRDGG